jgi:hypothetical protein
VAVQFRRRTHVALRLVDGDGRPLAREGIPLTIWIADSSGGHGSGYKTDARGRLDVTDLLPPPGSRPGYDLAVTMRAEGFFRSDLDLPNLRVPLAKLDERLAAGDPVTLSVPATSTRAVRFRVVDRGGRPVPGVRVRCESGSGTFGTEEVTSGADGFATVELRAAPRSYDDHLVALPPYHGKCRFEIRRGAETPPPLVVEASEAATILLLDETGAPIADTPVAVGNEAGRTGPGGDLHLDLPRSGWVYWIRVEGFLPATARLTGSPRRATVRLERSRSLEVVVTAPNGEIEKGTLYFLREGGEEGVPAWLTFREGRARWSGQTARGELRIRAFAGRDAWTATGIAHPGEDRVELELAPARMGELALRVRSADGKALPGAAVSITTSPGRIYRQATTDDAGLARFPLPVGEYRIRPQIGSRIPDRLSFPVEVPTGEPIVLTALATEPRTVRIEFPEGSRAGRSYQIRLVGPDGSTFALAAGKLPPDGGPVERQLLLPVGRFTLRVELDGRREEWSWRGTPGAPPPFVFD